MTKESSLQSKIIKYLESKGCYVVKTGGIGTGNGCPDLLFFYEGFYGALEVKASKTAKFQPLQKIILDKFDSWSYGRVVWPENWNDIKNELEQLI